MSFIDIVTHRFCGRTLLSCLVLVFITLAVYWQAGDHEFQNFR